MAVLADWIHNGIPAARATLLTPSRTLRYSGMVPGWISGQYSRDDGLVDLAALADSAGVDLVLERCEQVDPEGKTARASSGTVISYDLCSIDTGGVGRAAQVLGDDARILDVRPIDRFVDRIETIGTPAHVAAVGGGAGGVELAFGLRNRGGSAPSKITLVAGSEGLLPTFNNPARAKVANELCLQSIAVIEADATIEDGVLRAGDSAIGGVDLIVAALGSGAPDCPRESGLACDDHGFIAVDKFQRSTSHPHIFAAGDVAARQDCVVPHSGVHAVHTGPILADNLRAAAAGLPPAKSYTPRFTNLYLMSTGRGEAIASYGPFAAQGRWAAKLKHWIDTRWLNQYADLSGTKQDSA
ncbi:FAD-dependent oxidoreductase [Erythrobacter sp. F6033]|nr:FAD-dependent oxidoreductase [Erythrobacter sp. F6033]